MDKIKDYKKKMSTHKKALKENNRRVLMLKHLLNNRYENDYSKYEFSKLNDNDFKESINEQILELNKNIAISTKVIDNCKEGIELIKEYQKLSNSN